MASRQPEDQFTEFQSFDSIEKCIYRLCERKSHGYTTMFLLIACSIANLGKPRDILRISHSSLTYLGFESLAISLLPYNSRGIFCPCPTLSGDIKLYPT